jgi:hypothetical protein
LAFSWRLCALFSEGLVVVKEREQYTDLSQLKQLLARGEWQNSDRATWQYALQVARHVQTCQEPVYEQNRLPALLDQTQRGFFTEGDALQVPSQCWLDLDCLWRIYSNNRFGFGVQYHIWQTTHRHAMRHRYLDMGEQVGWRVRDRWLTYEELNFSLDAPEGHLPWWGTLVFGNWWLGGYWISTLAAQLSRSVGA